MLKKASGPQVLDRGPQVLQVLASGPPGPQVLRSSGPVKKEPGPQVLATKVFYDKFIREFGPTNIWYLNI